MSAGHSTAIQLLGKHAAGRVTLVDPDVYSWAKHFPWYATANGYAAVRCGRTNVALHRVLMGCPVGLDVDHINGDKLDNRRANLRAATRSQNTANGRGRAKRLSGSRFKGVFRRNEKHGWHARIRADYTDHYLGTHPTEEAAARAYDAAALRFFGAFARLNFPVTADENAQEQSVAGNQ